jgi:hypothetical protein
LPAKEENEMNAKNAKTTFSFNVFLASIAGEPLGIKYKQIAVILNVSESTMSKLRHGHLRKIPPGLQPRLMASRFASELVKSFAPTRSTVIQFTAYAQMINNKYLFSDSLGRFAALFSTAAPMDEQRARKFYSSMIPELIKRCYEEAYSNSELDYANWVINHQNEQYEIAYQKMCDTINQDVFDSEKLSQLLTVVYTASLRRQNERPFSDLSFIKMLNEYVGTQINHPFYSSVRRYEIISLSEDSSKIKRTVKAQEQIVFPSPDVLKFTLSQTFYHITQMSPAEIVKHAFENLICTVNNVPLIQYVNEYEHTDYTSPQQFVTATKLEDDVSGMYSTELIFQFNLFPEQSGETLNVAYEYSCTAPFIDNISCNYSYTLHYPCKFLEHEFVLDAKTRRRWGVRVKLFTPMTDSACLGKKVVNQYTKNSGTADSQHITFYDWVMPGSGYYRNIYELKYNGSRYES